MNDHIYAWLLSNEDVFITDIAPDVDRILHNMKAFPEVDLSDFVEDIKDNITDYLMECVDSHFQLTAEEFVLAKEDDKIMGFIDQLVAHITRENNGTTHTLH